MKIKIPSGKQILLPGMILAVAAMGLLFFLQIRWMNNSLQVQNNRYRRGVGDAMNHVARNLFKELGLDEIDLESPESFMEKWKSDSPYPDLIKRVTVLDEYKGPRDLVIDAEPKKEVYLIGNSREKPFLLVLDGELLYGKLLFEHLREYSSDYIYNISYRETSFSEIISSRKESMEGESGGDKFIVAYLPPVIDLTVESRTLDNILFNSGDVFMYHKNGDEGSRPDVKNSSFYFYVLDIDLNDGRGSAEFEKRIRRTNLGLIASLGLILVGIYYLLLRLYRDVENQRRMEQTFVASVSHELRTPIAVIKTASENLSRGVISDGDRVRSYGSVIGNEADRLNRMVEAILYYSRMEGSGSNTVHPVNLDPRALTEEILETLRLTYPGGALEAEVSGAPPEVPLDRDSYRLILDNLVTNGFLHGDGSSVRVRLESDIPARWRLIVEDDGPGLSKGEQKRIFDPFIRGRRSKERQIRGSGLGLFLVKNAAEAMGGAIRVKSPYEFPAGKERSGCRFTLIFPMNKEEIREPDIDD